MSKMTEWTTQETSTHQDHVIAHVVGTTVLGYFHADDALHMPLDIGFVWTIYVDGEMGLIPQSMAIAELSLSQRERSALAEDVARLLEEGREARGLSMITAAPVECLIAEVEFYGNGEARRLVIRGEEASLCVESSLLTREMSVEACEAAGEDV